MTIMAMPTTIKASPRPIRESFAARSELPLRHLRPNVSQEQIEPFYQEAEGHNRNCGTDPGKKGSFIGGVVAVALDHEDLGELARRHHSVASLHVRPSKSPRQYGPIL